MKAKRSFLSFILIVAMLASFMAFVCFSVSNTVTEADGPSLCHECENCDGKGYEECWNCDGSGYDEWEDCPSCGGDGCADCGNTGYAKCTVCGGDGKDDCWDCDGKGTIHVYRIDCTACDGFGYEQITCPKCSGSGLSSKDCDWCDGSCFETCGNCGGDGLEDEWINCPSCGGDGCADCDWECGHYNFDSIPCTESDCVNGKVPCSECDGLGHYKCSECSGRKTVDDETRPCSECHGNTVLTDEWITYHWDFNSKVCTRDIVCDCGEFTATETGEATWVVTEKATCHTNEKGFFDADFDDADHLWTVYSAIMERPDSMTDHHLELDCEDCLKTGKKHVECTACSGEGEVECPDCDGEGWIVCPDCDGDCEFDCTNCDGDRYIVCPDCGGDGCDSCDYCGDMECPVCNGEGTYDCERCSGFGGWSCSSCDGEGELNCSTCSGKGYIVEDEDCPTCEGTGIIINGEIVYEWSDDKTTCTAKHNCFGCEKTVKTETVNVVEEIITPATCTTNKTVKNKAVFEYSKFDTQYTEAFEVENSKGNHDYKDVEITWGEGKCTATAKCSHCQEVLTEEVDTVIVDGKETATFANAVFGTRTNEDFKEGLSAGAIVGISVGSVAGACLITYVVMFIVYAKKGKALKFLAPSFKWINGKIFKK